MSGPGPDYTITITIPHVKAEHAVYNATLATAMSDVFGRDGTDLNAWVSVVPDGSNLECWHELIDSEGVERMKDLVDEHGWRGALLW